MEVPRSGLAMAVGSNLKGGMEVPVRILAIPLMPIQVKLPLEMLTHGIL